MSKWDKDYIKLCKTILEKGIEVENRTGINTIKIPSYHLQFDLQKEFPCLTTKQLYFRQAILEMLWIYQAKSNDVRWLQERNVHIWDEWEIDDEGYWYATQNVLENNKLVKKEVKKNFGKEYAHTIGTAYGYIVNKFKLVFKFKVDAIFFQYCLLHRTELGTCDLYAEFLILDKVKRHDIAVTDTAENFGTFDLIVKIVLDDLDKLFRHLLIAAARRNFGRAEVGRKDDHALTEIHRLALAVSQSAVLKYLQENIQDTGIGLCRLFDLIKENNTERLFSYRICELSALFVTDISGRRADELLITVFLRVFGHIDRHIVLREDRFARSAV